MRWTPRQLAAHLHFIDREMAADDLRILGLTRLAQHGKDRDVQDFFNENNPEG